uniref:Ras-related protein Rab-12 n=1 Tax=Marmota marmota marmota TaxID=9994 RepID=A0A8C5Z8I8_MARMA
MIKDYAYLQVIIIGSRGVGKTSLMERFTDDTFCEACKSTVGVDFKIKTVELRGKKIRLQIWDTAGQERFNSITSTYYRSAKGIILVYDITKKETFDDLPKWMKMIDKYASEDAELLLVGNKLDCESDREITRQQGEKFAQLYSIFVGFCLFGWFFSIFFSLSDNEFVNSIFGISFIKLHCCV